MKLAIAAACLVATLALANHVHAQGRSTATLAQPAPARITFIAASASWTCEGTSCVSGYTPQDPIGVSECRELTRQVGAVADFKDEDRVLKPADIERCNRGAASAPAVTASR